MFHERIIVGLEKQTKEVRGHLDKLRGDAMYLRSLVQSQDSTMALLEYLQQAPFFTTSNSGIPNNTQLNLDAGSVLRQISGEKMETRNIKETDGLNPVDKNGKPVGGICLHINGPNITLHLCSHCSSQASQSQESTDAKTG